MSSFGARDLALLLPDQVGETTAFKPTDETQTETYEAPAPKLDISKRTRRYFPGQTPAWVKDEEEEVTISIDGGTQGEPAELDRRLARISQSKPKGSARSRRRIHEAQVLDDDEDSGSEEEAGVRDGEVLEGDSKLLHQLEVMQAEREREEDEEEIAARRQRVKDKLAQRRMELESAAATDGDGVVSRDGGPDDESSSEYETDSAEEESDEEDGGRGAMLKPLFVPKGRRDTIKAREEEEAAKELARQSELLKLESRKHQTRVLVAESLRRQEEKETLDNTDADSDAGLPDDTDDLEDDAEFENWKVREIRRMKREAETRERMILEAQDIERRRNMTDEERMEEDRRLGKFKEKEKKKWKFMQKYYHKGVFYMDESSVEVGTKVDGGEGDDDKKKVDARLREYNEPTLEDKYNREALPAVLQVKKFGLRGRTKYTHLVDQDTTDFRQPLRQDERVKEKYMSKRSGVGDINTAGRYKKKARVE